MSTHPEVNADALTSTRVVSLRAGEDDLAHDDLLVVEAPLEVRIGGRPVTVLMRTPGHDVELVTGLLFTEGVVADADDILSIEVARDQPNALEVRLLTSRRLGERHFPSTASCGICGKPSLASIEFRGAPIESAFRISRRVLCALSGQLRASQPLFSHSGGAHASGLFTSDGQPLVVREDVGRHNALDKLIGWCLIDGRTPLSGCLLVLSGRLSYELVQKAVAAGIPLVAAVGAPSSMAVELAVRYGVTLVGFLRDGGMNVYAHPARITH